MNYVKLIFKKAITKKNLFRRNLAINGWLNGNVPALTTYLLPHLSSTSIKRNNFPKSFKLMLLIHNINSIESNRNGGGSNLIFCETCFRDSSCPAN